MQELELVTENRQDYITEPSGKSHVTESSNGKWQHPLRPIHGRGNAPVARKRIIPNPTRNRTNAKKDKPRTPEHLPFPYLHHPPFSGVKPREKCKRIFTKFYF